MEGVQINVGRVTGSLIAMAAFVFMLEIANPNIINLLKFGMAAPAYTIITSVFCHSNFVHLFYNMLNIFIFGNLIELRHGSKLTFILFLSSAVFANIAFGLFEPNSYAVGMSGVVYAFIGAAVVLQPNARAPLPLGGIAVPVKVWFAGPMMAIGEFLLSFISSDNIAHIAHVSGFVVGIAMALAIRLKNKEKENGV